MSGLGYQIGNRLTVEERTRYAMVLSDRHHKWGQECPAVDLDFMLCEYNQGVRVAVVEYKHHLADLGSSNGRNYSALSELYLKDGRQVPLFIARYWPDSWAFRTKAYNEAARNWVTRNAVGWDSGAWRDQTEQQFVRMLYQLRYDVLREGDKLTIARLNSIKPPHEEGGAAA